MILARNTSAISNHTMSPFTATLSSARGYSNHSCECNERNKQCPFHFLWYLKFENPDVKRAKTIIRRFKGGGLNSKIGGKSVGLDGTILKINT